MKYRITIAVEIEIHPLEKEEHTFSDLMKTFREGLRMNHRIASRVEALKLLECRLIEPERTLLTKEVKSNDHQNL